MIGRVKGHKQKAYLPGNVIGSCIINILNLMKYANTKKIESLILLIDFRKAFDSLSHKCIDECLKMFIFGFHNKEMGLTLIQQQRGLHPPWGRSNLTNPVGTRSPPR